MGSEQNEIPAPPRLSFPTSCQLNRSRGFCNETRKSALSTAACEMWETLFDEAYKADVVVHTDCGGKIYAHANILGVASPVMKSLLKNNKSRNGKDRRRSVYIRGVPYDAVRVFIRFLYTSFYDPEEMEEFVVSLLVLSHAFVVPHLKQECERRLENGMLNIDNVIDIFQLAMLCNASRLSLICHRMVVRNFKAVSETDGWMAMKEAHPILESQILLSVSQEEMLQKMRIKKRNEKEMYAQLYDAMEALVHICRDGCRTIGPHDKVFKEEEGPCRFNACKGLELLVRHFAACKLRVPGGCGHCKRMWKLLELHSRLCVDTHACKVPLCRDFKERSSRRQNKKEDIKWRILAKKIVRSKSVSGAPYFSLVASV